MFGIGLAEFLVIIIIAIAVIPAKDWPVVARALARFIKYIRQIIWKITDATEAIKDQVERELPIDEIVKKTTDDVVSAFAVPKATRNQEPGTSKRKKYDNHRKS
jgi:Sec-independent protein translocase protein TatA